MTIAVTLEQVLTAREERVFRQRALSKAHGAPVVSFGLNAAGPIKDSPLLRRAFLWGRDALERALEAGGFAVLAREETIAATGCEMQYAVRGDAWALKRLCITVEDAQPIGRLFDMDVLTCDGEKLDRAALGMEERGCLVCGAKGRGCASRRVHTVSDLQRATGRLLETHFQEVDPKTVSALAGRALLDEVYTTPKPGLVDRNNNGSHTDMTVATFEASVRALAPYWETCVRIGMETKDAPAQQTFSLLREAGKEAERAMLRATGGVNTHKGAIFLLGILCGAIGRKWTPYAPFAPTDALLAESARLTRDTLEAEFAAMRSDPSSVTTKGGRLYLEHGIRGARGEAADGFVSVKKVGLPIMERASERGMSEGAAGAVTLLYLLANGTDTNMIARGGLEAANEAREAVRALLERDPFPCSERIEALDRAFIERNLSPGGCADLLAVTLFLRALAAV